MIVQLTEADLTAAAVVFTAIAAATTASIRWARTPQKDKIETLERQVGEIYSFLIKP